MIAQPDAPTGRMQGQRIVPASQREQRLVAERRDRVLAKRSAGMTYQQIADSEPSLSTASAAVQDAARALKAHASERLREGDPLTLELERLDQLERAAQTVMRTAASGPAPSPGLVLKAIDRLTRISARRSALLGLSNVLQPNGERQPNGLDEVAAQRRKRRAAQGW